MTIKNLWPTEVLFGTIPEEVRMPVINELLTSPIDFTNGDVTDTYITDKTDLGEVSKFINTFVIDSFKSYSKEVFDHVLEDGSYKLNAWTANGAGNYSLGFHNHAGAQLSAVFYLLVDDGENVGGKINFHDPRFNANRGLISPFKFKHNDYTMSPKSGDFVIFPSYLYHSASTFYGNTRLIIPVDLFVKD
jgi:hypothetical protein